MTTQTKEPAEPAVVDGEVVEEPPAVGQEPVGTEIVPTAANGVVIRGEQPAQILENAGKIATALKDLIERQGLSVNVGGKRKHVEVGGWQALGALLSAFGGTPLHAETVWTRKVCGDDGLPVRTTYTAEVTRYPQGKGPGKPVEVTTYDVDGYDWEACVEVRTPDGTTVGRAEAMCSRAEHKWGRRDDYALRSQAETRAESRAYRRAVGWIVSIAGYNPTPAEEMPAQEQQEAPAQVAVASPELTATVRNACIYLLDDNPEAAAEAFGKVTGHFDGKLPAPAGQAIVLLAKAVKDYRAKLNADLPFDPDAPAQLDVDRGGS